MSLSAVQELARPVEAAIAAVGGDGEVPPDVVTEVPSTYTGMPLNTIVGK